jgi:hypothetical protein
MSLTVSGGSDRTPCPPLVLRRRGRHGLITIATRQPGLARLVVRVEAGRGELGRLKETRPHKRLEFLARDLLDHGAKQTGARVGVPVATARSTLERRVLHRLDPDRAVLSVLEFGLRTMGQPGGMSRQVTDGGAGLLLRKGPEVLFQRVIHRKLPLGLESKNRRAGEGLGDGGEVVAGLDGIALTGLPVRKSVAA